MELTEKQIVIQLQESGLTLPKIAARLGVATETVRTWRYKNGTTTAKTRAVLFGLLEETKKARPN